MHKQLAATYYDIDSRNVRPKAQTDMDGFCKAVWCSGEDFTLTDDMHELYEALSAIIGDSGILFKPTGGEGALHWTLFQFQTFPVSANPVASMKPATFSQKDREDALEIGKMVAEFPPIHIEFNGIVRTRYGLFLAGYPSWDVNRLRDRFRAWGKDAIREPHPQDIFHATLLRFTKEPTSEQLGLLNIIVRAWRGRHLGSVQPRQWHYGYGTWLQGGEQPPRVVASWPAAPAHWILHRGLCAGPSTALENHQDLLCAAMEAGWDVELDLWKVGEQLYLGHDWADASKQPLTVPFFLGYKNAWIHCKNMEALAYMINAAEANESLAHYFVHDIDEATLTNTGEAWCYPGKWAGRRSICVLPERSATLAEASATAFGLQRQIAGVCSDYLPAYFLTADLFTFNDE